VSGGAKLKKARPLYGIPPDEILHHKVWEFDLDEENYAPEQDEAWVCPVCTLPVSSLENRVVVTQVMLANGESAVAVLSNVDLDDPRATREFITISVEKGRAWFHLARYFDAEYKNYGPEELANFIGLSVEEVFPIRYDISDVAMGSGEVVRGEVNAEPLEKLTDEERMSLVLGD